MPPKQPSKSEQKQKQKVVEDKTFGLKNKSKSRKVQDYVQSVQKQVSGTQARRPELDPKAQALKKKEEDEKYKKELAALAKPVQTQKVAAGVDPKSILCQFFKAGICEKGAKCKFSHDISVERKSEKINLYTDMRKDKEKDIQGDTMDKWDQATLEQVVKMKQKGSMPETDIVCKYFLEAVEKEKYGFFWECPNGEKCHYRHALPPGYTLKRDKKKNDEEDVQITIEEFIEVERKKLKGDLTPVTADSFAAWKKARQEKKEQEARELRDKKEAAIKAGKALAGIGISGRDLFTFRPDLFVDDDDAGGQDDYVRDVEDGADDEDEDEDGAAHSGYLGNDDGPDEDEDADVGGSSSAAAAGIDLHVFEDADNDVDDDDDDGNEDGGDDNDDDADDDEAVDQGGSSSGGRA